MDMKKTITFLVAVVTLLCVTSCCRNEQTLPPSKAKALAQKEMVRLNANLSYAEVPIGYFECNDADMRYFLRQLAACEMITYSCERIQKPDRVKKTRRVQRYFYYYSYYDTETYWVNDTVTTYFVTTALTEKGEQLLADLDIKAKPTADDKDMRYDMELNLESYPESSVEYMEFPEPTEEPDTLAADVVEEAQKPAELSPSAVPAKDTRNEYERAKDREDYVMKTVKAYGLKIVKARNIVVSHIPSTTAVAELVMEYTDVTPFGRVLKHVYNGQRELEKGVEYVFYQDKKWVVKDID